MSTGPDVIRVAAGVLRDRAGRILLSQRLEGKHLAGTWEFPGGKCDPGEAPAETLQRELEEELGIRVASAAPLLSLTHRYPETTVCLQLFEVGAWSGVPAGREGQALEWVDARAMESLAMPAADRPIVRALTLNPYYAITPDPERIGGTEGLLDWTAQALDKGRRLFQLRAHSLSRSRLSRLAERFGRLVRRHGGRWLLNAAPEMAEKAGADGVHLTAARLSALDRRPLPDRWLVASSCHDRDELARAGEIGADFVTVSPVRPTASHPDADVLGWAGLAGLIAQSPVPVYALGGVQPGDLSTAREHGAFGVAGIGAFGPS